MNCIFWLQLETWRAQGQSGIEYIKKWTQKKEGEKTKHAISSAGEENGFRKDSKHLVGIVWPLVDSNSRCHIEWVAFT